MPTAPPHPRSLLRHWWVIGGAFVILGAAPAPKAGDGLKEFGTAVDPDKDCTFTAADGKLTIAIPKANHTLTTTPTRKNAPRVLRDVEGDFTATVRVAAELPGDIASDLPGVDPGVAAGLVVWADDGNYVCLVRVHELLGMKRATSTELHYQADGEEGGDSGPVAPLDTAAVYLRVTRAGAKVTGEWSKDGTAWQRVSATDLKAASKVKVGPFLEHNTGQKVTGTFDKYEVKNKK